MRVPSLALVALALAPGCKEGDRDDGVDAKPADTDAGEDSDAATARGAVRVTVTATFARPPTTSWSGLDYTAVTSRPIRRAEVWLEDVGGNLLATGVTDDLGVVALELPVAVAAVAHVAAHVPDYGLRVVDNTAEDALWTLSRPLPAPEDDDVALSLHAGLAHDGTAYTDRASGPFAILDTALGVLEQLELLVPEPIVPLDFHWSPDNVPTRGDLSTGQIGTSFHSWGSGVYLLGAEDADTDEYDETVIAHETFHYVERAYSRSDSKGGSHDGDSVLHMSVAFSEGSATALGNLLLGTPYYRDTRGARQSSGFEHDLERNRAGGAVGWYGSRSVSGIVWDVSDATADAADTLTVPRQTLFDVLTGPQAETPALTSIFSFGHALREALPAQAAAIDAMWRREDIVAPLDPWGTGETNDGGDPGAISPALYRPLTVGAPAQLTGLGPSSGPDNRTRDFRYYRFVAPASRDYEVTTEAPEDVDLRVLARGQRLCEGRTRSGYEDCEFTAVAGQDYVIEIDGTYLARPIDVVVAVSESP